MYDSLAMSIEPFNYDEWFASVPVTPPHGITVVADHYLHSRQIEKHDFFQIAAKSPDALRLWVTQELVVTGEFAKQLHLVSGRINNTNLRAMVDLVTGGENGKIIHNGVALSSHPNLLDRLRESMDIPTNEVQVLPETREFLDDLERECQSPLRGVGALGVGNEKMIADEYGGLMKAFESCLPDTKFKAFLLANISEDTEHANILAQVGTGLINQGFAPLDYYEGAKAAVDARFTYYDHLLGRIR